MLQYGQTFQSEAVGRWHSGQFVWSGRLQYGQTLKPDLTFEPHPGQVVVADFAARPFVVDATIK